MQADVSEARRWALEEFGSIDLGHRSRTTRLVRMVTQVAARPGGKVSAVFTSAAAVEGAYRWLENPAVEVGALVDGLGRACAVRASEHAFVYVPVDGSSVTLVDAHQTKDFGLIGPTSKGARGIKVLDAIAVSPEGVPLGVAALEWWCRAPQPRCGKGKKKANASRATKDKETQHWLDALTHTTARFAMSAPETRCWFQLDREADSWPVLHHLEASGHWFTVRASRNRRLASSTPGHPKLLRAKLARAPVLGTIEVAVAAGPHRQARVAQLRVRALSVRLELRHPWTKTCRPLTVNAVWARETRTTPRGEKPLDWLLFTNHTVDSFDDACLVVHGYCQRWRIEEFHKTWKSGACKVEDSQLRSSAHAMRWATLLAAVALRIERLKFLSRTDPKLPATIELTRHEIRALVLWKRRSKKRTEPMPSAAPTLADAVLWIAQMGGYTGKSSGGPPGSITIGRGLERLRQRAEVLEDLESSGEK
jgi:transposase-like protein/transposase Tn5 family protein